MDRKKFIKRSLFTAGAMTLAGMWHQMAGKEHRDLPPVGFNHIPHTNSTIMPNTVLHRANTRGHANHGWLDTYHTFSFASYYNPDRMSFGALRVLNDDTVAGGMGFGTHPHNNMEIISIPLKGDLEHKDSMGNVAVIRQNDIQILSAGTGITHSEYNKNRDSQVNFLQIWVLPKAENIKPRYDQITLDVKERENKFQQIVSPSHDDAGVWINQDAWFSLGNFAAGKNETYKIKKPGNGVYVFVLEGSATIQGEKLNKRDGIGVWDIDKIDIKSDSNTELLLMDVPMEA
ncbi:MAG: pirin family protein [Cytophagales bacterium]|nr:pirin family protein [Cytophagales bacterium]